MVFPDAVMLQHDLDVHVHRMAASVLVDLVRELPRFTPRLEGFFFDCRDGI